MALAVKKFKNSTTDAIGSFNVTYNGTCTFSSGTSGTSFFASASVNVTGVSSSFSSAGNATTSSTAFPQFFAYSSNLLSRQSTLYTVPVGRVGKVIVNKFLHNMTGPSISNYVSFVLNAGGPSFSSGFIYTSNVISGSYSGGLIFDENIIDTNLDYLTANHSRTSVGSVSATNTSVIGGILSILSSASGSSNAAAFIFSKNLLNQLVDNVSPTRTFDQGVFLTENLSSNGSTLTTQRFKDKVIGAGTTVLKNDTVIFGFNLGGGLLTIPGWTGGGFATISTIITGSITNRVDYDFLVIEEGS